MVGDGEGGEGEDRRVEVLIDYAVDILYRQEKRREYHYVGLNPQPLSTLNNLNTQNRAKPIQTQYQIQHFTIWMSDLPCNTKLNQVNQRSPFSDQSRNPQESHTQLLDLNSIRA